MNYYLCGVGVERDIVNGLLVFHISYLQHMKFCIGTQGELV